MELFNLTGDVAVVIGATGALGGGIADGLGQAGAKVAVLGRNAERGEARVSAITKAGGVATFVSADAIRKESLQKALSDVEKKFGTPTILVNAAGGNDLKA